MLWFSQLFEFSQAFMEVLENMFSFLLEYTAMKKGKPLVNFDYQNVKSLCLRHHYINSLCQFCVSNEHNFNQSALIFSQGCCLIQNIRGKHKLTSVCYCTKQLLNFRCIGENQEAKTERLLKVCSDKEHEYIGEEETGLQDEHDISILK